MSLYQPAPEGFWRSSPAHTLLWAITGVLHHIEREIPEAKPRGQWERKLAKTIGDPVAKFDWTSLWTAKHVRKAKGKSDAPKVPDDVAAAWADLPKLIEQMWMQAAETRADALDLPFDKEAMQAGFDSTMSLITSIPDTLHDRLQSLMEQAYQEKTGPQGFAKMIRDEFADVARFKSEQIAMTEWNRAASTATLEGYKAQGIPQKIWYTLGDNRVCEECEENAAMGAIPINETFFTGDSSPPAHPGCRCDIAAA